MQATNLLNAENRSELRQWLVKNHDTENQCWVRVKRGRVQDDDTFWYIDAVEEALCFGWIDSTVKRFENGAVLQKLAPRRKKSA